MAPLPRSLLVCLVAALGIAGCAGAVDGDIVTDPSSIGAGTIVRAGSGKCLDVSAAGTGDGVKIQQYACNGTAAQSFRFDDAGNGLYEIVNLNSNKCLDVKGAGTADGTVVQQWACHGGKPQLFAAEDQGNGYAQLRNPNSNKCVDVASASNSDGAAVQIWSCNGTSAQMWKISAAGGGGGPGPDMGGSGGGGGGNGGFVHPGVLVNKGQLDFVKAKVAARQEPWWSAYNKANNSSGGSLGYTPHPYVDVQCGPTSNPDIGCTEEKNDSAAAYTHALLWYVGGNAAHAQKAIEIMNAWARTIQKHSLSNAPLESAWTGSLWPRAGELIRHTYTGWAPNDVTTFRNMLKDVYLPQVVNGSRSNGNWEASMIEATIGIAVFLDDKASFDKAVAMWKRRTPAMIYLTSDGAMPVPPPGGHSDLNGFWYHPARFVNGLLQETCRDLGHVQYGLAALTSAAETARLQGVDLFALEKTRLQAGYEFTAQYLNRSVANSSAVCNKNLVDVSPDPMWEIAYNALTNRLGVALPQTSKLIGQIRPTGADHHMQWETLSHASVGNAGL